jgi:hypothetical protein
MRMLRGYAIAAILSICALASPSIAAASPGVGVIHDGASATNMERKIDTLNIVLAPQTRADVTVADQIVGLRAQMLRQRASYVTLDNYRSTAPRAPLGVGAVGIGSVRHFG